MADVAAYLDAEMSPSEEIEFELHLAKCKYCVAELNRQKELLHILDSTLHQDDIELPENFTKVVVTNAESSVKGLRRRSEWLNAVFVCCALAFFGLFALGADASRSFGYPFRVFERIAAVVTFFGHLMYDVAVGIVVILRTITSETVSNTAAFVAVVFTLFLALALIARQVNRHYHM
jgi:anti-sigma factor RsiW